MRILTGKWHKRTELSGTLYTGILTWVMVSQMYSSVKIKLAVCLKFVHFRVYMLYLNTKAKKKTPQSNEKEYIIEIAKPNYVF